MANEDDNGITSSMDIMAKRQQETEDRTAAIRREMSSLLAHYLRSEVQHLRVIGELKREKEEVLRNIESTKAILENMQRITADERTKLESSKSGLLASLQEETATLMKCLKNLEERNEADLKNDPVHKWQREINYLTELLRNASSKENQQATMGESESSTSSCTSHVFKKED